MNRVTIVIIATLTLLFAAIFIVIALARGYQFDFSKKSLQPTGILVATSDPDGAELFLNGKLQTATNNTINLTPGHYRVKIVKDGFYPWEKELDIKQEEVFKTNAFLFPAVPDLRPLTLTGAINPATSPDNSRIVYGVASASAERNGVWVVDTSRSLTPASILSGADFRQIYRDVPNLPLSEAKYLWSPDSREVIAYFGSKVPTIATPSASLAVLLAADRINDQPNFITGAIAVTLSQWNQQSNLKTQSQWAKLAPGLSSLLSSVSANLTFSPDETKILYRATSSATLPLYLSAYLPGSDPTPEVRNLAPGNTYVYDTKEDKNYLIENCLPTEASAKEGKIQIVNCTWFPSSRHLLLNDNSAIALMEYDGSNKATVYAGPFRPGVILTWPNWSKIVILTTLNNVPGALENLYTINLR